MQTEINGLLYILQTIVESEGYAPSASNNRHQLVCATGTFKTFQRNHLEYKKAFKVKQFENVNPFS
jgi:hypothetical protein